MGRRTSIYLTDEDLARLIALGFPPIGEVFRAGLAAAEQAGLVAAEQAAGPAQAADDSQR
jgi:hypothetical protein